MLAKVKRIFDEQVAVCVLGDTPYDVIAAHDNGLPVIAVATGIYSCEQLSRAEPDLLLHSFVDLFVAAEAEG